MRLSLTNRLLAFFMTMLAVVLVSFSLALFFLARNYLDGVVGDRLDAALDTLAAAAEVRPDGVEWEPAERQLRLGSPRNSDPLVWTVTEPGGKVIDRFGDSMPAESERWRTRQRMVEPSTASRLPDKQDPKTETVYARLSLVVGCSLEPMHATLRWLAVTLAVLCGTVWLITLFVGRMVCRKALVPVRRMAEATRSIDSADLSRRLPRSEMHDELDALAQAFNDLLARLEDFFERQRRFTAEASHQLRTPLASILGQIEVILRRPRDSEDYVQVLGSVHEQGERLAKIIESLLFLARADSESRAPGLERVDLRDWLSHEVATWSDQPRFADLTVDPGDGEAEFVAVQPVLLGEVVSILWRNACKFSAPGTAIAIRLRASERDVELSVEDHGMGITAADMPHLFTPFFRSPEARRRGIDGIGLGLAIARRIAVALGGSLRAERTDSGARFVLSLPTVTAPAECVAREAAART
jgi:heavy metal sensor kinase